MKQIISSIGIWENSRSLIASTSHPSHTTIWTVSTCEVTAIELLAQGSLLRMHALLVKVWFNSNALSFTRVGMFTENENTT
jgi:hypothetical protein